MVMSAVLRDHDVSEQPRDDHGRWTGGGGGSESSGASSDLSAGKVSAQWNPADPSVFNISGSFDGHVADVQNDVTDEERADLKDQLRGMYRKMEDSFASEGVREGSARSRQIYNAMAAVSYAEEALDPSSRSRGFIAVKDDKMMGGALLYLSRDDHSAELAYLGSFQRGAGSALLRQVEDAARKAGKSEIHLYSTSYAQPFYEKHGYKYNKSDDHYHKVLNPGKAAGSAVENKEPLGVLSVSDAFLADFHSKDRSNRMAVKVNGKGRSHAASLVSAGKVNTDASWSFSADDGNKLLGENGDDWANYAKWFLAIDASEQEQTKAYYKFPFGKGGEVYRSALVAAKQRAAQQGYSDVESAADTLLTKIDGAEEGGEDDSGGEETDKTAAIDHAWATLEIKAIDDHDPNGCMYLEGMASTPETDRQGEVVEPQGAKYKVPMPFLWQHNAEKPIGLVEWAQPNAKGIPFRASIARQGTTPYIDEARALIKAGLVRGVSIGFRSIKAEPVKAPVADDPMASMLGMMGPRRYKEWEWLELSAVTIPANASASIQSIKSFDQENLRTRSAASGITKGGAVSLVRTPGVTGSSVARQLSTKGKDMQTIAEQIAAYEAKRAANLARMNELMTDSAKESRTLTDDEAQEYDDLEVENGTIDKHLTRMRRHQKSLTENAEAVNVPANGGGGAVQDQVAHMTGAHLQAPQQRGGRDFIQTPNKNLPKGMAFVRYAMLLARAKGNVMLAREYAKDPYIKGSTPEVEKAFEAQFYSKAAVNPGTTTDATWAGPLVQLQPMASEFIEFLYPMTILGRINGFRRVPFNVKMPRQTTASSASWVGQGQPKPVSKIDFDTVQLGFAKVATIIVMTEELVRFSNPSAEGIARTDMAEAIAKFLDVQFIDPTVSAVVNVSPASVTNGAMTQSMTSADIAGVTTDANALFAELSSNNIDPSGAVWVMNPRTAQAIGTLRTSLGVYAFPTINLMGGTFMGLPVIVSNNVAITGGSPATTFAVLLKPSEILLADDGGVNVDLSNEASLQMDSAPSSGAQQLVSLWQSNLVGIRAEQFINWLPRRDHAVAVWTDLTL